MDYFFPGYHVWAKLIESLADLGYDANTMVSLQHAHLCWGLWRSSLCRWLTWTVTQC